MVSKKKDAASKTNSDWVTVPTLTITTTGSQTTLSWTGGGTLESANQLTGPYLPIADAANPYTINSFADNPSQYFRVVK